MENFKYWTPTKLVFGKGTVTHLPELLKPLGNKVLLTYGGGSIKKIGLYDQVKELLKNFEVYELGDIEPNPKYNPSVVDGVKLCKEHNIDVILSVGGGSVLDCSKAIAAGACYEGEAWDLISYKVKAKKALPIVDIITVAATGSEFDSGAVISRTETNDKIGYIDDLLFPVASIIDPTYTFSLPRKHTVAGVADAINHILEQYMADNSTTLTDGMSEAALRSLMLNVKKVIANPEDYDARAEIFAACTLACNGILSIGNGQSGWPMHGIEHALSGHYDITHGEGLAIITPRWMDHILNEKTVDRFVALGTHLFEIDPKEDKFVIAEMTIKRFYEFFESIGIPMHLKEVGIDEKRIDEMAHHIAINEGLDNPRNFAPLSEEDIKEILIDSL